MKITAWSSEFNPTSSWTIVRLLLASDSSLVKYIWYADVRDAKSCSSNAIQCVQCTPLVMSMKRCCSATSFTRSPWDIQPEGVWSSLIHPCQSMPIRAWLHHGICVMMHSIRHRSIQLHRTLGILVFQVLKFHPNQCLQSAHPPVIWIIWVTHQGPLTMCYPMFSRAGRGTLSVHNLLRHSPCSHLSASWPSPNAAQSSVLSNSPDMTPN